MSRSWVPPSNELRQEGEELKLEPSTLALASRVKERSGGWSPLVTPVFHSSTYVHRSTQSYLENVAKEGYIYQRLGNPTTEAAALVVAEMEGAIGTQLYASGMDAISAVLLSFLKAGDHILCQRPCYSGTSEFIKDILVKFGVEVDWVRAGAGAEEWRSKFKANTRLMYGETPSNPTLSLLDLEAFGALGQELGILTAVDATFASPYLLQPLSYGLDFSIHSATKYMGGHSDLIAGAVSVRRLQHWQELKHGNSCMGGALSGWDSALLHRGLKTLPLRMREHSRVALAVAEFLAAHPKVKAVHYPGLPTHPQRALAKRQMPRGCGGMMAVELGSEAESIAFSESLKLFSLAVSLGGVESLITVASATTHGPMLMSDADRAEAGIAPGLLRISVGIEDPADLIRDMAQALDALH